MSGPVTYRRDESIATITMDDGKVNALGPTMLQALTRWSSPATNGCSAVGLI
jgi:hypothetical protein